MTSANEMILTKTRKKEIDEKGNSRDHEKATVNNGKEWKTLANIRHRNLKKNNCEQAKDESIN